LLFSWVYPIDNDVNKVIGICDIFKRRNFKKLSLCVVIISQTVLLSDPIRCLHRWNEWIPPEQDHRVVNIQSWSSVWLDVDFVVWYQNCFRLYARCRIHLFLEKFNTYELKKILNMIFQLIRGKFLIFLPLRIWQQF
jgi:hypothetical protein